MTKRRRVVFVVAAVALAGAVACAVLLGVDIYLHGRYQKSAGFNVWGYRGKPVGRKQRDEYRVVVLGGSAAYGYGVGSDEAIPAVLEQMLRRRASSPLFTVVNLAYNNEGAYAFKPTLEDYAFLRYDLAILYEGYNDLSVASDQPNLSLFRHTSPVYRLTGYMPIFPIVFKEKAAAMLSGGDPGALYRQGPKAVFHADLATRAGAGMLNATAQIAQSLEEQLGRVSAEPAPRLADGDAAGCGSWANYCRSISAAIEFARAKGAQVIVATQPYLSVSSNLRALHVAQQDGVRQLLSHRFGADPDVTYVNLGESVDLEDPHLSFDHMHLRTAGNETVAAALVNPVMKMAARRRSDRQ
jgi:hypothetical protein